MRAPYSCSGTNGSGPSSVRLRKILSMYVPPFVLHPGEAEVLALAQSMTNTLVLLDDKVARGEARRLDLRLCDTMGFVVRTRRAGLLSLDQTELLIQEIAQRPHIWTATKLGEQLLASLRS
jgi:predicted nucleic acid-binding protein